ncbi:MAG: lysoplasmalogenase [Anaerolineae bacterium]|nr:lysoplasmalogenase [Anaerolineae bacterium]
MLNVPLSSVETVIFAAVILLWAALLLGGFIFGKPTKSNPRRMPRMTRLASSFVLVAGAWFWFAVSQGTRIDLMAFWFAVGMTCGLVGDIFLARVDGSDNDLLYGMISFALGHIAYVIGIVQVSHHFDQWTWLLDVLATWWAIGSVGWLLIVFLRNKITPLHFAALPYSLLLANTGGFAAVLAMHDSSFSLIVLGAALFLLSDAILALKLFRQWDPPLLDDFVWLTYGPGQMLIVFGVFLYLATNMGAG